MATIPPYWFQWSRDIPQLNMLDAFRWIILSFSISAHPQSGIGVIPPCWLQGNRNIPEFLPKSFVILLPRLRMMDAFRWIVPTLFIFFNGSAIRNWINLDWMMTTYSGIPWMSTKWSWNIVGFWFRITEFMHYLFQLPELLSRRRNAGRIFFFINLFLETFRLRNCGVSVEKWWLFDYCWCVCRVHDTPV